jgi:hypothetical protein
MHPVKLNFERAACEFAEWRARPEDAIAGAVVLMATLADQRRCPGRKTSRAKSKEPVDPTD